MTDTRHEGLLERPIIGPFGKGSVDIRIVDFRLAMNVFRNEQAFPWHPRIEHPEDEVKEAMIADFTRRATFRHREVREDNCTGMGVISGLLAEALMMYGPHVKKVDSHG